LGIAPFVGIFLPCATVAFFPITALLATIVLLLEDDRRPDDLRTASIAPECILDPDHGSSFPGTSRETKNRSLLANGPTMLMPEDGNERKSGRDSDQLDHGLVSV
jgi:hypothetical protein